MNASTSFLTGNATGFIAGLLTAGLIVGLYQAFIRTSSTPGIGEDDWTDYPDLPATADPNDQADPRDDTLNNDLRDLIDTERHKP